MAVRSAIVDDEQVPFARRAGQTAIFCKPIVVLTQRADDVCGGALASVTISIFLILGNGNMMIAAIHTWPHKVGHAAVKPEVHLVAIFYRFTP